jgi:predicted cupin superfamily sugar epimerase
VPPDDRASALMTELHLQPHPEGGHFREVYRSPLTVAPSDGRSDRAALTTIYFLLRAGEHSALHRVRSDEVWHFYEGDPLELVWWSPDQDRLERAALGPVADAQAPVAIVPAGSWQAARTTGAYTLVGCTVAPGFDFADFALMRDDEAAAEDLRRRAAALADLL